MCRLDSSAPAPPFRMAAEPTARHCALAALPHCRAGPGDFFEQRPPAAVLQVAGGQALKASSAW